MGELWQEDGFGGGGDPEEGVATENDWDEGEESLETTLEDGFDDPEEDDGDADDGGEG